MAAKTVQLAGRKFVILPEAEYTRLKREATVARAGRQRPSVRANLPPVEVYSDQRIAEFLLSNAVDGRDYARACEEVRRMGIDPQTVRHSKPPGAR